MSSTGTTRDTTPLLPWRPAILSPGCSLRFTATNTLTIFITPGGSSSPRCSFSTLLSKRACSRDTAASNSRFSVSISAITASSCTPIWRQAPRGCSASTSSVIGVPALMPLKPPAALRPSSFSRSRLRKLRSWIAFSSSRSLASRSISARSIAIARSSLSTPRRLNTRTSTIVPDHARRQLQRGVAHVGRLLAEDRAQQLFFRRHRALALRRHLADQDVARVHFGADIDDAGLVEVLQRLLADVRDVAGDLLLAELGVARHHLEFLDVDRGEHVVARDPLGDQDRVLEVVAVPGHERAQHVAPQRQLAELGRGAVGDDVAVGHAVAHAHQRTLVDAGGLVGAHELAQPVDVDALGRAVLGGRAHHDARAVDLVDHAGAAGDDGRTRVARDRRFHAGADQRRIGTDQRHRLALHVRCPSARGWRRRSPGTGSAPRPPRRAASATRRPPSRPRA